MADKKQFRIRRLSNGDVFGPLTAAEAKDHAGYPEEFEVLEDTGPSRAGYEDAAPKPKRDRAAPAKRKRSAAVNVTKPAPPPPPAPSAAAPAGGDNNQG